MRIKALGLFGVLAVLLLTALLALSLPVRQDQYQNLLLITPANYNDVVFNPDKIEQFCEDEFLLTYEIRQSKNVSACNSKHQATLIGTNSSYRSLTGYELTEGAFFTKAAWKAKDKHVVLNETAAFEFFGSRRIAGNTLKIEDETWLVAGVLQDDDEENANVYAPSSLTGGQPKSLLALLSPGNDIGEVYVKNSLKQLGFNETNHTVVNLQAKASLYGERFDLAWKSTYIVFMILFIREGVFRLHRKFSDYKSRLNQVYLKDLIIEHYKDFLRIAGSCLLLPAGFLSALLLLLQILQTCLTWQDLPALDSMWSDGDFLLMTSPLQNYQLLGTILFALYLILLGCIFLLAWKRQKRNPKTQREAMENGKTELA